MRSRKLNIEQAAPVSPGTSILAYVRVGKGTEGTCGRGGSGKLVRETRTDACASRDGAEQPRTPGHRGHTHRLFGTIEELRSLGTAVPDGIDPEALT